jgi:DNA/RNA-binding domain of Phe-tRNA-synthetase-like protein
LNDWESPTATTVDTLDLAEDSVKVWRSFFTSLGINETVTDSAGSVALRVKCAELPYVVLARDFQTNPFR